MNPALSNYSLTCRFPLKGSALTEKKTVAHRVSIAILDINDCSVGHQQVDDLTVAVPGCQHQTSHLWPKRTRDKEAEKRKG